jgi:HD-like signal output (HDOD) protein
VDAKTFLNKLDSIPDIPTLPTIIIKLNEMLQDQDVSIKHLSATIEKEQALVTKILRLVNSTFYGSRSKTNNIPHAVIMLGFNTISSLNPETKKALSRHLKSVPDWFPKIAPEIDSACEFFLSEE